MEAAKALHTKDSKKEFFGMHSDGIRLQHGTVYEDGEIDVAPQIPLSHVESPSQIRSLCHYLEDNDLQHTEKNIDQCEAHT
jgi:hypothetical protein